MNDAIRSAETGANLPPLIPGGRPLSYWLKKFLFCNPFYLASAALLLFGLCRVSMDSNFLPEELSQLTFNFTSLQCYELLLVVTAMLLARRFIWYDAKLLVALENMLVLVPFMLISQAALIEQRALWIFCGAAALFAIARSSLAQRGVTALRFPPGLAVIGMGVLMVNTAWPVIYRHLHQSKVGTKIESGAAFGLHQFSWLLLLPALIALANLLPRRLDDGKSPVQCRRFPVGLFTLWLCGTAVHLYSLGYVYDFDLRREWLAPSLWILAWTLHFRLPDYAESLPPFARKLTFILPLPVTLVAACDTGSNVFFALNLINLFLYARTVWNERGNRLAVHLTMLASAALVAAMPEPLFHYLTGWFNRTDLISLAFLTYVMAATFLTRNPKAAFAGCIAAALAGGGLHQQLHFNPWHWAAQSGIAFFLLHSLRWRDYEHEGASFARILAAVGWVIHSVIWVRDDAAIWHPLAVSSAVLVGVGLRGLVFQRWTPLVVPLSALLVAFTGPANFVITKLLTAPAGVTAIFGSFLLFAIGTAVALTKHRWHKHSGEISP